MTGYSRAMKWQYLSAILLLLVTTSLGEFIVVTPSKPVVAEVGQDAVLGCQLVPSEVPVEMEVRWFREDWSKVVHLYRKGQDSPESQIAQYSGGQSCSRTPFPSGNVSLLLKKVTVRDAGRYKCFVVSQALDEEGSLQLQVASMGQPPTMKMVGYEGNRILVGCISKKWVPTAASDVAGRRGPAHHSTQGVRGSGRCRAPESGEYHRCESRHLWHVLLCHPKPASGPGVRGSAGDTRHVHPVLSSGQFYRWGYTSWGE